MDNPQTKDQVPPPLNPGRMSAAITYSTYYAEEDAAGIRQAAKRRSTVDPTSNPMQSSISTNSLSGIRPARESVHAMHEATTFKGAMQVLGEDVARFAKTGNFKDYLRICYHLYCWTLFWLVVTLCVLMEPFLCSWRKPSAMFMHDANWIGQIVILGLSSLLLVIQVCAGVYLKRKETDGLVERIRRAKEENSMSPEEEKRLRKQHGWESIAARNTKLDEIEEQEGALARETARAEMEKEYSLSTEMWAVVMEGAIILETTTLLGGWFFIFYRPGLASLRCFRLLRILYFHQLPREIIYRLEAMWYQRLNPLSFVEFHLMEKAFRFASQSLTSLGREMFFLTAATRGGLLLMCLLGFFAFVVGMAVSQEIYDASWLSDEQTSCKSVGLCTLVMLRLTFFDGTGLDLFTNLSMDHKFLFCIVILYLCTSSFGIVNGLIGLFGEIFRSESTSAFRAGSSSSFSSSFSFGTASSSTPLLGYSENARLARGDNVRVPGPGRLFKGDVVVYRSTFVANDAKSLDLRSLGMATDVRPLEGDFDGLVGVVTDVHLHSRVADARHNVDSRSEGRKRGAISQINISQFAAARRGTVIEPSHKVRTRTLTRAASSRQDLEKGLLGLRDKAEYGMTYSVHFEGREQVERFRVEFFPTYLNPQPHSTLLHLLLTRRRASGAEDFNDDGDFQPLAGVLELLPVAQSVEERVCKLLEQHSEADLRQQGQGQGLGQGQEAPRAAERLDVLEASVRDLHSKMDRLITMLGSR